jgi:hypothetical protein
VFIIIYMFSILQCVIETGIQQLTIASMGRRLFIYYLIQKSLIILMICETIQKKWIVY